MEINKTNITNEVNSSTISVYTSNINIKYVNKLCLMAPVSGATDKVSEMESSENPRVTPEFSEDRNLTVDWKTHSRFRKLTVHNRYITGRRPFVFVRYTVDLQSVTGCQLISAAIR